MEQHVSYLNRALQAIRKVNQFIVYERNRDRMLDGITELLVDTRGYYNAWIVDGHRVLIITHLDGKKTLLLPLDHEKTADRTG